MALEHELSKRHAPHRVTSRILNSCMAPSHRQTAYFSMVFGLSVANVEVTARWGGKSPSYATTTSGVHSVCPCPTVRQSLTVRHSLGGPQTLITELVPPSHTH